MTSKNPPIVIVPPLTPPEPGPLDEPPALPAAPGVSAVEALACAPATEPAVVVARSVVGWVKDRTVITPNTAPITSAAPSSETAILSRKPRDIDSPF